MYERIVPAMERSINEIYATLGSSEKLMVEKLIYEISTISKKRIAKFLDISPSAKVAKERSTRALEFIQSLKGKQDSIKDIDKLI
jgi:predicted transcriptional regulator